MNTTSKQLAALRVTALAATLLSVYGVAQATDYTTLKCTSAGCTPADPNPGDNYSESLAGNTSNKWVVNGSSGANFGLDGGTITAKGSKFRGVGATGGNAHILLNGVTIETNATANESTTGWGAHGVTAFGSGSVVTVNNSQITTLGGGQNATHVYSEGIQSGNGGLVQGSGNTITTSGSASYGIEAFDGGAINLTGGSITTTGDLAAGVRTYSGVGSTLGAGTVTLTGTTIHTGGANAAGLLAGDSAEPTAGTINANNVTVTTTGLGTSSAPNAAMESAYGSTITSTDSTLRTEGLYGYGAYAHDGGAIVLNGGSVTTANATGQGIQDGDGSRAYALYANGTGSSVSASNGTTILTNGQRAYGAYAINGGSVSLDGSSITTHGFMAYGLYSSGADSVVNAKNVNITTTGDVGDAVWAYAGGTTNINGGTISVEGVPNVNAPFETANGLVAVGGLGLTAPGTINASNLTLQTAGPESVGVKVGSQIGDDYTSGVVNLANSTVTVTGADSVAAWVSYGSTFKATSSTLASTQSDGIAMTDNANVTLNDTTVQAAGASMRSEFDTAGQTQSITCRLRLETDPEQRHAAERDA